jgi:hypothetical protein
MAICKFYISADGNDSDNGLSEKNPFQTIGRLNSLILNAGDQILFKCGEVFPGELNIRHSGNPSLPIVISSYGKGPKPILTGAIPVSNWKTDKNNRYSAKVENKVYQVFSNNIQYDLARIPAKGFFVIENGDKNNLNDIRNLRVNYDLTGATARIRAVNWQYETAKVSAHSDGKITFAESMMYQCNPRYGYILDNKYEFLSEPGQWFWDEKTKSLTIISLENVNPELQNVEACIYQNGICLSETVSHIQISNLHLEKYENAGILGMYGSSHVSVSDCQINDVNVYGICLDINSHHYFISNNTITDIRGRGISTLESSHDHIADNSIARIGLVPGYGFDGVNNGIGIAVLKTEVKYSVSQTVINELRTKQIPSEVLATISTIAGLPYPDEKFVIEALEAILDRELFEKYSPLVMQLVNAEAKAQKLESTGNIVANNAVDSTGYAGIRLDGNKSIAECNIIKNTLLHMNDGGALYCWAQNADYTYDNIFRNNIIIGAVGNCEATANDLAYAYGIYTDNKCHHILIENNTVVDTVGGILINDEGHHQKIVGNTLYDNQFGLVFSEYFMANTLTDCEAFDNILFCKRRNQRAIFVESRIREGFKPGLLNRNLYANPYYPFPILELTFKDGVRIFREFTLESWQKHYGQDKDSKIIATANHDAGGKKSVILINEEKNMKKFKVPDDREYGDIFGNKLGDVVELEAYSSMILLER